ncbi:unnamed protein product [Sphagnum troendelagicum]
MPLPALNVINHGSHAGNKLAMQEFMILPVGAQSFKEAMQMRLKVNQIGSATESIQVALDSKAAGWGVMISHHSGETEDTFIADLAVRFASGQINTRAPCRSELLAKYNQLYYELKRSLVVYTMLVWSSGSPCKVSLWRDYIFLPYLKYSSRILAQICYQEAAVLGLERMQLLIIRMWMTIKPSFPLHTLKREDYKCRTHQCFFLLPHECILLFFQRQSKCSCIPRDEVARIQYSSISLVW